MKKLAYIIPVFLVFAFAFPAVAANNAGVGAQTGTQVQQQDRVQDPTMNEDETSPSGNQVRNVNQVSTQNMGAESQLQIATSEMEQLMNEVGAGTGIGAQVRTLAQEQVQAQTEIQGQMVKMETRSKFVKGLVGPDFKAIDNLKAHIERNILRIEALTQLKNEISNEADETALETAIQALINQNTALEERINAEEETGSLFGWLVKLFSN